jgi:hypothetical protein
MPRRSKQIADLQPDAHLLQQAESWCRTQPRECKTSHARTTSDYFTLTLPQSLIQVMFAQHITHIAATDCFVPTQSGF